MAALSRRCKPRIDSFALRGQQLGKFHKTKKFLYEKKVQFAQDFPVHQHGRSIIILYTNMIALT